MALPADADKPTAPTRIKVSREWIGAPTGNALLLGQNYHLIHHLWTTIPWYRYQRVFERIEGDLAERGARIEWRKDETERAIA